MKRPSCILSVIPFLPIFICGAKAETPTVPLVVHEWGTFTTLQDEDGMDVGRVNGPDEGLPNFVHNLVGHDFRWDGCEKNSTLRAQIFDQFVGPESSHIGSCSDPRFQLAKSCHPDVFMRLETPVIYFYPKNKPVTLDLSVKFRSGWLTEFFPAAEAEAPGFDRGSCGSLKREKWGTLSWHGIEVGGASGVMPATDDNVWTSPRNVPKAASIRSIDGEGEKFLFYRGVSASFSPLWIRRKKGNLLISTMPWDDFIVEAGKNLTAALSFPAVWLVESRGPAGLAFRELGELSFLGPKKDFAPIEISDQFAESDFSEKNGARLKKKMRDALIASGLFPDEANAMLETWRLSYFQSPGQRVFAILPRSWVEYHLPLTISVPTELTRVMIGRFELITPREREALAEFGKSGSTSPTVDQLATLKSKLGRFAFTLIFDEQKRRPTPPLATLVDALPQCDADTK